MRDRLSPIEDDNTVRRYLNWEASTPSCLKLEAALFKALRYLPQWQEMRLSALREHLAWTKWLQAVTNVINAGARCPIQCVKSENIVCAMEIVTLERKRHSQLGPETARSRVA
jgi:hypothetical protein